MTHRVLYLMPNAVPGGAERATMMMLAYHDRRRYLPSVLFFSDGPLVSEARALGIDVTVLARPMRLRHAMSVGRAIATVRRLARLQNAELIHSCMSYAHLVGGPTASWNGTPAVFYQHGPVGSWMDGAATIARCDRILTNSADTAAAQKRKSWRRRPLSVVPLAVAVEISCEERPALRARVEAAHGISPHHVVVGMIARFDPLKGIDVALRSLAPVLRLRSDMRFVIVGGQYRHFHAGYEDALRALAEREGIDRQVIFAGYQIDVRPYLSRMDLLVHASRLGEAFGLTLLEAMACSIPVAAARIGGVPEIVDDGRDGLLHTPGNEMELRGSVERLLDDRSLREALVAAGRQKVESQYRPRHMMRTLEAIYDEVVPR